MAADSVTSLSRKLGIKDGFKVYVKNPPENYMQMIAPIPENVRILNKITTDLDLIHLFTKSRNELESEIYKLVKQIKQNGMIWVSWPKKSSKVATDITEDVIRAIILPMGLVDMKVCAVDDIWSGLKLVIRKENRK